MRRRRDLPQHPIRPMSDSFWMRRVADGVGGVSEVMFPGDENGAPDWRQTDMVSRTVDYLGELPPRIRRLVMLMFVVVELGAPLLFVGLGRFSRISAARRDRAMQRWPRSWLPHHRLLAQALKAQLCMMYLSHPAVQHYMGAFKTCAHPRDVLSLPVRPASEVYDATTADGLRAEAS